MNHAEPDDEAEQRRRSTERSADLRPRFVRAGRPTLPRARRVSSVSRVYDAVRLGIRNGTYQPAYVISEDTVMRSLNVTRASVREALSILTAEGVVSRSTRRGTAPILATVHINAHDVLGFDAEGAEVGERIREVPRSRHVYLADPVIGSKLGLSSFDRVRVDEEVITVDGRPVGLRFSYTPLGFLHDEGSQAHGIHLLIKLANLGIEVARVDSAFEAIIADRSTAEALDIPEGSPILLREMIHYSTAGSPVMMTTVRHRSDSVIVHTTRSITPRDMSE